MNNVIVNAGLVAHGDVMLEVGTSQQAVEVQAQSAALQTEDAKAATTITNKLVDNLPLVVGGALRSPFDLATLTPEAKNFGDNNSSSAADNRPATAPIWTAFPRTRHGPDGILGRCNTPSVEAITELRSSRTASRPSMVMPAAG